MNEIIPVSSRPLKACEREDRRFHRTSNGMCPRSKLELSLVPVSYQGHNLQTSTSVLVNLHIGRIDGGQLGIVFSFVPSVRDILFYVSLLFLNIVRTIFSGAVNYLNGM
ncbi:hypothetical protein AVEN_137992-1 [Araneus ventricosus]|uniref:Uncharacterized protein n=1 Tax=Araneus ventricosus TaxID=182803 RepID=A0A4Y2KPI3_ARAVE|nr:hypothetical protein AVEN_137992-1 [Araneus ventricosus]